jgi:hypothetical protein
MKFFTSLWFKIKKSTGLPPNNVYIPLQEEQHKVDVTEKPKKTRKPREIKVIAKRAED